MDSCKVNVVGWYDNRNCGDESYKKAFPKVFPEHNFIFTSKPVENADSYIIGGGDVLTTSLLELFSKINKPKHIMSVTVSKIFDKNLFDNYKTIIVRDLNSKKNLDEIGVESFICPDFSFSLDYNKNNGQNIINKLFEKEGRNLYEKRIAVIVNAHLIPPHGSTAYEQQRFERFAFDLSIAIDETPASFIFIPFGTKQPWDDRISNGIVSQRCKWWKKNVIIFDELNVQDTIDIISSCDAVVSSRLHSSIFSTITGTPFVDITHNHKNKNFLETIGYEKVSIGFGDFNKTKTVLMLKDLITNKSILEEIQNISLINKLSLKELSKNIII